MKPICILAIETSCDDTCVAILKNDKIIANETISSLSLQSSYGGVVPEIAARSHADNIAKVFNLVVQKAKIELIEITHIAYTNEPGLPGSLHIGKIFAKALATNLKVEAIPINHMMGHAFSWTINTSKSVEFPLISAVISGGHTAIYRFLSIDEFTILAQTRDDAVGEVLDKIGRVLGFEYPGGISIDKNFDAGKVGIKMIPHTSTCDDFSFSGLKTHVTNMANSLRMKKEPFDAVSIASSALEWCVAEILQKIYYYVKKENITKVYYGGGVSANAMLRQEAAKTVYQSFFPELKFSGDNAAMIAQYCNLLLKMKKHP